MVGFVADHSDIGARSYRSRGFVSFSREIGRPSAVYHYPAPSPTGRTSRAPSYEEHWPRVLVAPAKWILTDHSRSVPAGRKEGTSRIFFERSSTMLVFRFPRPGL